MGIFDDRDDKTEEATPKKREEARKKGQVAWSQEMSMSTLLIAAVLALEVIGSVILDSLEAGLKSGLTVRRHEHSDVEWFTTTVSDALFAVLPGVLPFMTLLVVFAFVSGIMQIGFKASWEKLAPNLDKLNPISGFKRILSLQGLVKAGLAVLKISVLGVVLWIALASEVEALLVLPELPFAEAARRIANLGIGILWWIAIPLFGVAFLDLMYQRWQHARNIRMSKTDIRDENKQAEGDPEVKARIKRAQREISRRRMMDEVPKAEVILTNPTHYSVALRYERGDMTAPRVVAKGTELVALRIREIAREHGVPIVEDPPLARALWRNVSLGDEIPPRFYRAVAAVLGQVMRLDQEADSNRDREAV